MTAEDFTDNGERTIVSDNSPYWFQSAFRRVVFVQIHLYATYGNFHKKKHQLQLISIEQHKLGGGEGKPSKDNFSDMKRTTLYRNKILKLTKGLSQ